MEEPPEENPRAPLPIPDPRLRPPPIPDPRNPLELEYPPPPLELTTAGWERSKGNVSTWDLLPQERLPRDHGMVWVGRN